MESCFRNDTLRIHKIEFGCKYNLDVAFHLKNLSLTVKLLILKHTNNGVNFHTFTLLSGTP